MSIPKADKQRKIMIDFLRKEGNKKLLDENKIRPVQRVSIKYAHSYRLESHPPEFMLCPYCKGLYRLNSLPKHCKKCPYKPQHNKKCNVANLVQNILALKQHRSQFLDKLRLKDEVFPGMHADRIAYIAKADPIICQYGEDYLRKHKRGHIRKVVSNKTR